MNHRRLSSRRTRVRASFAVSGSSVASRDIARRGERTTVVCLPDLRECDDPIGAIGWIDADRNRTACADDDACHAPRGEASAHMGLRRHFRGLHRLVKRSEAGSAVAQPVHQRLFLAAVDFNHRPVDEMHQRRSQHCNQVRDLGHFSNTP